MVTQATAPLGLTETAPSAHEVTVAFVDIVGFTRLCEELPVDRVGDLVGWLERAAADAARPPVSLVKLVGDAAMIVGPEPAGVVAATLAMLRAAACDPAAPPLHAGIASGRALHRGDDWLGRPVNLANHLAARAGIGTAEATTPVAWATAGAWTPIGTAPVEGLDEPVALYRLDA